jgi:hypothetical protein
MKKLLKLYDDFKGKIGNEKASVLPAGQVLYDDYLTKLDIDKIEFINAYTQIKLILKDMAQHGKQIRDQSQPKQVKLPRFLIEINKYINKLVQEKATQSEAAQIIYDILIEILNKEKTQIENEITQV